MRSSSDFVARAAKSENPATVCAVHVALVDDLAGLRSEWEPLFASDPTATPFASYEWLCAWCRYWPAGGRPWILAMYEGDRLVGIAPFLMRDRVGLRLLRGLGLSVGNYWDVIASPDDREKATTAIAEALRERSSEWDAFFMDKLPEESNTIEALRGAGLRVGPVTELASPRIELPDSFDDYLASVSSKRRKAIRRTLAPLDRGELTVRSAVTAAEVKLAVERWQFLKTKSWTKRNLAMDPEHRSRRFREFTTEALTEMVSTGQAIVWETLAGGEVITVMIGLLDEKAYYAWLVGFDPHFSELQPGHMTIAYGIRWSIERGLRYYDFMLGAESYKYHYAPEERFVVAATIGSGSLRSRAAIALSHLRHARQTPRFPEWRRPAVSL